jgi:hypothetical protein
MTPELLEQRWNRYLELAETLAVERSKENARAAALAVYADAMQARDHFDPGTKGRSICTRAAARAWQVAARLAPSVVN